MLKRIFLIAVLLTTFVAVIAAAEPIVVATHAVFGEIAGEIGDGLIEVVTIIPPGFCPAHYDLCPSDIAAFAGADLVFYSGFEAWVDTLLSAVGNEGIAVSLPGPWNTPEAAAAKADAIAAALAARFPDKADTFRANAADYEARLAALAESLRNEATARGVEGVPVICMEWQVGFVSWLGFDVVATYPMPEGLSMRDLVELADAGREGGAILVIDNWQSGIDFGKKLAEEIGAVHVVLSNFPGFPPGTASLIDLFSHNAEALFSAIEPAEE